MRAILTLLLLVPAAALAANDGGAPYQGRPVADVIDEYRERGEPFAYSTNLVSDDLIVTEEPEPGSPLNVVRQILRPHGLTVEERSGVYLVMRFNAAGLQVGSILLVI